MHYTLSQWIMRIGSFEYYSDTDLLQMHQELHDDFGEQPNDAILESECKLTSEMRSRGFEHRHADALAAAAGTVVAAPRPPEIYEVASYMRKMIRLQDGAVSIVKGTEGSDVYVKIEGAALQGLEQAILKMLSRWLPPGIVLKLLDQAKADGGFVEMQPTHDLILDWNYAGGRRITTWDALGINITIVAAKSAPGIFFAGKEPKIPFRVVKADRLCGEGNLFPADSCYVFGPTLIPGKIDKTTMNPDGSPTGAIGDVAGVSAVRGAFEFWTAAKRAFEVQHEFAAGPQGRRLGEAEVTMLDNFTAPCEMTLPDRDGKPETFPAGTWFQGARILNPGYALDALERRLNAWSIYANCLGSIEEVPA